MNGEIASRVASVFLVIYWSLVVSSAGLCVSIRISHNTVHTYSESALIIYKLSGTRTDADWLGHSQKLLT